MKKKKLGWTDLNLTSIGLGTWAIGGAGWEFCWGAQDDSESARTIRHACELGVNWIDTAPVYGLGHSEEIVGNVVKEMHDKPFIATKGGRDWNNSGKIWSDLKKQRIRFEIESSLRRLRVEAIDLYQVHWPIPETEIEEAWGTIVDAIDEGKIRYAGVCNFNVDQLKRLQAISPVASLQVPYSLLRRDVEKELLEFCALNSIGVLAYSPLQKGLLTDSFNKEKAESLATDDHRRRDPMFQEPTLSSILATVARLRPIAQQKGKTMSELAIAWCLRRPEVTAVAVGARRPAQIEETVRGGNWEMTMEDAGAIEELLAEYQRKFTH